LEPEIILFFSAVDNRIRSLGHGCIERAKWIASPLRGMQPANNLRAGIRRERNLILPLDCPPSHP
jgi:hypothetical protein